MKLQLLLGLLMFAACGVSAQEEIGVDAADAHVVEFHIPAGTHDGPWNTLQNPIVVHIGDILRFVNDDDVDHWLHTSGSPCPHGTNAFGPGETYDCVISKAHTAATRDLYDHNVGPGSYIYIQAN